MPDEVQIWKDTTTDLNIAFRELISYMGASDTRVGYLRDFEHVLSLTCPDHLLWTFPEYRELDSLSPLPENMRAKVTAGVFRNYVLVYEQIMRKIGLIDKDPVEQVAGHMFDLGDDRMIPAIDPWMKHIARPGAVWLTSGERGGGKTHTAVAVMEMLVKHRFPSMPRVVVCTNVIFYHKVHGRVRVETPPGVFHITTMRELFPIIVDTIDTYGRDVLIMLVLDEAQGFIGGDSNFTNSSIPMKEMLGTIRKYNLMVWFLTPTARSIGPAFRNMMNGKNPGNVTCRWRKDMGRNAAYIKQNRLPWHPREVMAVMPYDDVPAAMRVPVTEWTKTVEDLREGEYCYDHIASATFKEGDGFDFNSFNETLGGVASIHALDAIRDFYRRVEKRDERIPTPAEVEKETKARAYVKLQSNGVPQTVAAKSLGVPRTTLNDWARELGLSVTKDMKTGDDEEVSVRQENGIASTFDDGRDGGSRAPPIYISEGGPEIGGAGGDVPSDGEGCSVMEELPPSDDPEADADGVTDTPIPDGRYTFEEFSEATRYCIGE